MCVRGSWPDSFELLEAAFLRRFRVCRASGLLHAVVWANAQELSRK